MPTLLLENGPDRGKGLELQPGGSYTLGRDPHADLVVHGELVSRHHAKVKEFKGSFWVKDNDSLNGIYLNDQRVQQAELKPGDKLQLGDTVLTFLDESLAKSKEEKTLGGYRLLERVGRGGMGTVYRAIQISLDREVALKVLSPELVKDKAFVEQFFREARAAGQLNHPHIVQVYDVGQEGDTYYYSMEFVRGGSLEDRLRREGRLPVAEVLRIAHEAAMALEYAESRHIVHRDIKPDNLMLAEDGRVRVADLGLALSLKSSADHKGQPILGTPHFISPEQALRREIDIRSDVYSLGATMYRMLAGRTLFLGDSAEEIVRKAVREEPQPLREVAPAVPEKVAALVHRMLRKDPNERFASAKELRAEVEKLTRHPGRTKALIAALVVAVVAIGIAVHFALKKQETRTVVVESPDSLEQKKKAFEAQSEAGKLRVELEALRAYLAIVEKHPSASADPERKVVRDALAAWQSNYKFLTIGELERASRRVKEIDDQVAGEVAAAEEAKATREKKVAAARDSVKSLLDQSKLLDAFVALTKLDPEQEPDVATRAELVKVKGDAQAAVAAEVAALRAKHDKAIADAVAAGTLDQAAELCGAASSAFSLPADALPAAQRGELDTVRDAFAARGVELRNQIAKAAADVQQRDAARLADVFGGETRGAVLQLELGHAADRVEQILATVETKETRAQVEPVATTLRHAQVLLDRFLADLEAGKLPPEPVVKFPDSERGAELVGYDRDKRLLKLKFARSAGQSSQTRALAEAANANLLRQLFVGRFELTGDERIDFAELMRLVEVTRWADSLAPLAARVAQYDPKQGWGDDLRAGLPQLPPTSLADDVALALKSVPDSLADAATQLKAGAQNEQVCREELTAALEPFRKSDSSIGWAASCDALRKLLVERESTLLLRIVKPWLVGT